MPCDDGIVDDQVSRASIRDVIAARHCGRFANRPYDMVFVVFIEGDSPTTPYKLPMLIIKIHKARM
jgi:hypothetical protein